MRLKLASIFLLLSFAIGAQSKETLTYSIKGNDTLKLDVYKPNQIVEGTRLPILIWMHGGGFAGGSRDLSDEVKLAEFAASKGYVAVSISYRLLRKDKDTGFGCDLPREKKLETFKQGVIDYMDAVKFLLSNAEKLNIDTRKIIAGGSSAGAEVVLNAVYMREYFIDNLSEYENFDFSGIFSLAGAMVNSDYITQENAIPTVMFHGTKDNLVPFGSDPHHFCKPHDKGYLFLDGSSTIINKLNELKTSYYFNVVEGGMHEVSSIPFGDLEDVFEFFKRTILNEEVIQTKIIKVR